MARNLRSTLTRIIDAAATISQGDLTTRIGLERQDELGIMSQHFDKMAEQLQDRELIRETFGCYLSSSIATEVLNQRDGISLGGEESVVTVLFSDLRGYSSISEQISPSQVVTMLNQYLGAMNAIIDRYNDNVIECQGDSTFAVFGAPNYQTDHAEQGMRYALAMIESLAELNQSWRESGIACRWQESGIDEIKCQISLHCGRVIGGNISRETRIKYSVIGDTVNVAARLENLNKQYESSLLISRNVYIQLPRDLTNGLVDQGTVNVKGRDQSVQIYSLSCSGISVI